MGALHKQTTALKNVTPATDHYSNWNGILLPPATVLNHSLTGEWRLGLQPKVGGLEFRRIRSRMRVTSCTRHMSHVMRKPVNAICEQQRRRSACSAAQSDQRLCFRCLDSIIPVVSISEILSLYLASEAEQPVWILPGRKSRRQVFSWRGSYVMHMRNERKGSATITHLSLSMASRGKACTGTHS